MAACGKGRFEDRVKIGLMVAVSIFFIFLNLKKKSYLGNRDSYGKTDENLDPQGIHSMIPLTFEFYIF